MVIQFLDVQILSLEKGAESLVNKICVQALCFLPHSLSSSFLPLFSSSPLSLSPFLSFPPFPPQSGIHLNVLANHQISSPIK